MIKASLKVSRADAQAQGLLFFRTNRPCKWGHRPVRYVKNGACVACARKQARQHYRDDPERHYALMRSWTSANYQRWRSTERARIKFRYARDANFRLRISVRGGLRNALLGQKQRYPLPDIGCSIEFLRKHVERQFEGEMAWENHGSVWTIDHIKALSWFDLTDREQYLEACHWTNIQPLLVQVHRAKNVIDRRGPPQLARMPELLDV
jgi:hypothetical protein